MAVAARWIDTAAGLEELARELEGVEALAVDTEFHRERTYYPKLALVQIAWDGGDGRVEIALVDPLAVPPEPLARLLTGGALIVMHAASQDIEVLEHACGAVPPRLFDTQVAAGFVGYSTPSLSTLVAGELGERITKGDRLTDWLRRPLGEAQLEYAASDVLHLEALRDRLTEQLTELGRLEWAEDECELLRVRSLPNRDPDEAWLRIKETRSMKGRTAGVAQAIAAWRERRAAELDQPVRFVMGDLGVVGIAQRAPSTLDQLAAIRGVDTRHARGQVGEQILAAVAEGAERRPSRPPSANGQLDRSLRPAATLVSAWLAQRSRDLRFDPALLATRADIEGLLAGDPTSRLAGGWRAEIVGGRIRELVEGRAALAFDGSAGLVLEGRAGGAGPATEAPGA